MLDFLVSIINKKYIPFLFSFTDVGPKAIETRLERGRSLESMTNAKLFIGIYPRKSRLGTGKD